MHLDTSVADAYLRTGALPRSWLLDAAAGDGEPAPEPDVPEPALAGRLGAALAATRALLEPFRPARPDVWDAVLPGWSGSLGAARVALVVGWPAPYEAGVRTDPGGHAVVVLDVARLLAAVGEDGPQAVADAAQGLLDHELAHVVLAERDPLPAGASYADRIDRVAWDEGLAHWFGAGTHPAFAPGAPGRAARQRAALADLALARAATGARERREWLDRADAADGFWDKYACVAGLLACVDAAHASGPAGVRAVVDAGWRGFAGRLLAGPVSRA